MSGQLQGVLRSPPRLAIVVPCFNEQHVLPETASTLLQRLESVVASGLATDSSYICFVDDGSTDDTWQLIEELHQSTPRIRGLKLTRNFGHQAATLAGMLECDSDAVVTIDADLQDDDTCIGEMLGKFRHGSEVVLGVRGDRSSDGLLKRATAQAYYRILERLGVNVVFNHADFRLLSHRAVSDLRNYPEANLFLRGMVPLLGLPTAIVRYSRRPRTSGKTKYPARKMVALGWQGITSFSVVPLRLVAALGFLIALGSLVVTAWALVVKLGLGAAIPGWASTVVPMYFLGGVQILCLGVIGEYVGKIYLETKNRPRYAVEIALGKDSGLNERLSP